MTGFLWSAVLLAVLLLVIVLIIKQLAPTMLSGSSMMPSTLQAALAPSITSHPTSQTIVVNGGGGDSRYDRAPQPLRDAWSAPEYPPRGGLLGPGLPFNIPTKGLPDAFQSVGIITVDDKVLPLYGRRTAGSSDRWNYYTRTDTYNPVPLPVRFQKRDCMGDPGCQEIMSGEKVVIDGMHKEGKTEIYKMDGPKYIPGLL